MAINKNFVIKNGAEINTKLFVADADNQKIGIGTTVAYYDLHVYGNGSGGIGVTYATVTGVTTTQALIVSGVSTFSTGPVLIAAGEQTGTASQGLQVGTAITVSGAYISGNLGIGITLPDAKLQVVPTASGVAGLFTGTTSNDMVRITQLGAGNALVVEDSANPDATSFVVSGLGSVGIGTNVPRYLLDIDTTTSTGTTAVYIRGDVKITGDLSADDLIFDQATFNTLSVSGFSTLGGASATLLNVSGITTVAGGLNATEGADLARLRVTGITTLGSATATELKVTGISTLGNISAGDLTLAGVTTGLTASGISTLTSVSGTDINYIGVGTIANVQSTNLNVSGVTTVNDFNANGSFDIYSTDVVFHNDVTINGNVTIGGTSAILNAVQIRIEDKDIVLGFTTAQEPTDDTANHGGIAVASTEGTPLVSLQVVGINTLPDTYKQIMWVKRDTMGAGTTDAFLFNYGVGIGSTQVPNGTRLAVGAVQITDDAINVKNVLATNINTTGVTTSNSYNVGATQVISSGRELQNIASLDATTTSTIEAAIKNAPNELTDLKVTGISTLGQVTAEGLVVTGITTLGDVTAKGVSLAGIVTGLNASGISTLGSISGTDLNISGVTTVGIVTGATSIEAGVYYGDGSQLQNIISGVGIQSGSNVIGYGFTTLNFVGTGNTFAVNGTTIDISIQGGGGGGLFIKDDVGITTTSPVGVGTTTLDDPDLVGVGNSFQGLYIRNGMMIVDNSLNGDHYIGTNFNGLMAGPVTVNGTLTVDGNWVVV